MIKRWKMKVDLVKKNVIIRFKINLNLIRLPLLILKTNNLLI